MILLIPALALEVVYCAVRLLGNLKEHVVWFIPLALGAGILYLISVWLVFRGEATAAGGGSSGRGADRRTLRFIFAAGLLFRATLFPLYPSLSDDLVRYRWDGKIQTAGYNPYLLAPADPALGHLRDETYPTVNGKHYVAVYGPLTETLFRWWYPVSMLPGNPYVSVVLTKLPLLAFDFGAALLLVRLLGLLGLPATRVLIYWWSPLAVIEFAASGHNDSVAVFFLLLALVGLVMGEKSWALAALALSTLAKLFSAFLWVAVLPRWIERGRWCELLWPALCAAVVFWPYRAGLFNVVPGVSVFAGTWRNNDSLFGIFYALAGTQLAASAAYGATVAGLAGYLAGRGSPPLRAVFLILGAVLLFSANVFPWYLTWVLPLLAIFPNAAWLLFTVLVFLSYNVLISYNTLGEWEYISTFWWLEYVPFYALLLGGWIAGQRRARVMSYE